MNSHTGIHTGLHCFPFSSISSYHTWECNPLWADWLSVVRLRPYKAACHCVCTLPRCSTKQCCTVWSTSFFSVLHADWPYKASIIQCSASLPVCQSEDGIPIGGIKVALVTLVTNHFHSLFCKCPSPLCWWINIQQVWFFVWYLKTFMHLPFLGTTS